MLLSLPPQVLIVLVFCLIFSLTFHEFGHAYTAHLCGDDTAKASGRMSLNPLVHLDLVGGLMVLIVGFGYARPVPVNPNNYRVRNADFYIALAGPLMNFLLGLIGAFLYGILAQNSITILAGVPLQFLLKMFIIINFNLFLFNLIPLGPLDGNSILPYFLPINWRMIYQQWNFRYGSYALIGLVILSIMLPNFNAFSWINSISTHITKGLL